MCEAVDLETSLAALRASPQAQCAQPLCGRLRVRGAESWGGTQ